MKKENEQTEHLQSPVLFDYQLIDRITFDLIHINQGWDDKKKDYAYRNRSSYDVEDIVELFEQFRFYSVEWSLGINKEKVVIKGTRYYRYHWETSDDEGYLIRIVLDLPTYPTGEGIIVTIFKI